MAAVSTTFKEAMTAEANVTLTSLGSAKILSEILFQTLRIMHFYLPWVVLNLSRIRDDL